MPLEVFTGFIKDLDAANPTGNDPKNQGDDHLRGMKFTSLTQFAGFTDGISLTVTESEVNQLTQIIIDLAKVIADTGTAGGPYFLEDGITAPQLTVVDIPTNLNIINTAWNVYGVITSGATPIQVNLDAGAPEGTQHQFFNAADADVEITIAVLGGETVNSIQGVGSASIVLTQYGQGAHFMKVDATQWAVICPVAPE